MTLRWEMTTVQSVEIDQEVRTDTATGIVVFQFPSLDGMYLLLNT